MESQQSVPLQLQLAFHLIKILGLWVLFRYMDNISAFMSQHISPTEIWFVPLQFVVVYIMLEFIVPRIGLWLYGQVFE